MALEDAVMSKHLLATTALRHWLCRCLVACFAFTSVAHHLYGTVKAFQAAALSKQAPALCRASVVAAIGALTKEHGQRLGGPMALESVMVCAKQLPLRDLSLRLCAMDALGLVLEGTAGKLPPSITNEAIKAVNGEMPYDAMCVM